MNILQGKVNFLSQWRALWAQLTAALGPDVIRYLGWAGVGLIVWSLVRFIINKHQGGRGGTAIVWTLLLGALLAAPGIIAPLLVRLAQWAVNAGLGLAS